MGLLSARGPQAVHQGGAQEVPPPPPTAGGGGHGEQKFKILNVLFIYLLLLYRYKIINIYCKNVTIDLNNYNLLQTVLFNHIFNQQYLKV